MPLSDASRCTSWLRRTVWAYSINSSARASKEEGTLRPSAFAVLRLTTNSNFVGFHGQLCWLCPFQDFVGIRGGPPSEMGENRSIGHESAEVHEFPGRPPFAVNLLSAAMLTMRSYSPNSIGLGITMIASARSLVIAATKLSFEAVIPKSGLRPQSHSVRHRKPGDLVRP